MQVTHTSTDDCLLPNIGEITLRFAKKVEGIVKSNKHV